MESNNEEREFGSWLHAHIDVLQPGQFVVDLGCGLGYDARFLSEAGLQVVGIDRSPTRLAQAAERAPAALFIVADIARGIPIQTTRADIVTASLSLHYFDRETTNRILQDIVRLLRSDGVLLCRVNVVGETTASWGTGIEHEPDFYEVEPGKFKRFFSERSLEETLGAYMTLESIFSESTQMIYGIEKRTIVARARAG